MRTGFWSPGSTGAPRRYPSPPVAHRRPTFLHISLSVSYDLRRSGLFRAVQLALRGQRWQPLRVPDRARRTWSDSCDKSLRAPHRDQLAASTPATLNLRGPRATSGPAGSGRECQGPRAGFCNLYAQRLRESESPHGDGRRVHAGADLPGGLSAAKQPGGVALERSSLSDEDRQIWLPVFEGGVYTGTQAACRSPTVPSPSAPSYADRKSVV